MRRRLTIATLAVLVGGSFTACIDRPSSELLTVYEPAELFADAAARSVDDAAAATEPVAQRRVVLPGGFSSILPGGWDGWASATTDTVGVAVHADAGRVDAWIYAERPSERLVRAPSLEWDRFLRTVAPGLSSPVLRVAPQPPRHVLRDVAGVADLPLPALRAALADLETRTLGRGLGFTPSLPTFSGYRWLAVGDRGAWIHVAHVDGWWGAQPPRPERVDRLLAELTRRRADGSRPLEDTLAAWPPVATRTDAVARLVVGRVMHRGLPLHLALLCRSPCAHATALEHFLDQLAVDQRAVDQLAVDEPARGATGSGDTNPVTLAYRHGVAVHALDPRAVWGAVGRVVEESNAGPTTR